VLFSIGLKLNPGRLAKFPIQRANRRNLALILPSALKKRFTATVYKCNL
jgi:hypothetical protein